MLTEKVGPHFYDRWDLKFNSGQQASVEERINSARPSTLAGLRVEKLDTRDGYRFVLEGGYWALVRISGTEPLLRIYAEADSQDSVAALLAEARAMAGL